MWDLLLMRDVVVLILLSGETMMSPEMCPPQSKSEDRRSRSHSPHRALSCQLNAHHSSVTLADFDFVKVIGKGSFGVVSHICQN